MLFLTPTCGNGLGTPGGYGIRLYGVGGRADFYISRAAGKP